jgi:hypothetical protein
MDREDREDRSGSPSKRLVNEARIIERIRMDIRPERQNPAICV